MALGGLAVLVALLEQATPITSWVWLIASCLVWPHLALLKAHASRSPFRSECANLMFDSFIAGTLAALVHFNTLPAVILVAIATADKISTGVRGLWLRSLPMAALGILIGGIATGFAFHPHTSMPVLLACLPVLVLHTFLVSMGSYRLLHRLQARNRALATLSREDVLTSVFNRRYWSERAEALRQQWQDQGTPACLMLLDIDQFKQLNDRHGHGEGDKVLRALANHLSTHASDTCIVGRLGGDEFALVAAASHHEATRLADSILKAASSRGEAAAQSPTCTVSIGLSLLQPRHASLERWLEAADKALYKAKHSGRNRVQIAESGDAQAIPEAAS